MEFLAGPAQSAAAIYILGDLFDVWVGEDINADYLDMVTSALKKIAANNIPLFFMSGNRDFLITQRFLKKATCKKIADPSIVCLHGHNILLTHGDKLCTQDVAYQRYRKIAQNPITRFIFNHLPQKTRAGIAEKLRRKSKNYQQGMAATLLDVWQPTAESWMQKYQVQNLIHGHVHRPAIHTVGTTKRVVLGDWHNIASFIFCSPEKIALATYSKDQGIQIVDSVDYAIS